MRMIAEESRKWWILIAMGATPRNVRKIFFLQGALIVSSTHPDMKAKKFKFTGWIEDD